MSKSQRKKKSTHRRQKWHVLAKSLLGLALFAGGTSLGLYLVIGQGEEHDFERAKIAMANRKPRMALPFLESALAKSPHHLSAMSLLAEARIMLRQFHEARSTIERLIEAEPASTDHRQLLVKWSFQVLGDVQRKPDFSTDRQQQRRAIEAMSIGLAQAEWLARTADGVGESFFLRAMFAEVDAQRLQIVMRGHLHIANLDGLDSFWLGSPALRSGLIEKQIESRLNEAEHHLASAIDATPGHYAAWSNLQRILAYRGRWDQAWRWAQCLSLETEIPAWLADQTLTAVLSVPKTVAQKTQQLVLGQQLVSRVATNDLETPQGQLLRARLLLQSAQPDAAQPLLEAILEDRPKHRDARFLLAQSFYDQHEYTQTLSTLESLGTNMPLATKATTLRGLAHFKLGDIALARSALDRAVQLDPEDQLARLAWLDLMMRQGSHAEVRDYFRQQYQDRPSDSEAIRRLLQFERSVGHRDAAAKLLEEIQEIEPLLDDHLTILADGYSYLRQFKEAGRFARQLVKRRPDAIDNPLRLVEILFAQGREAEAKTVLTRARERLGATARLDFLLSKLLLRQGRFDRVVALLRDVVRTEPGNHAARLVLAEGLAGLDRADEAFQQIESVLAANPSAPHAYAAILRISRLTGRNEVVGEYFAKFDPKGFDETAHPALLAEIKLRSNDAEEAAAICRRALAVGNTDPILRILLAEVAAANGATDRVEYHLSALVHEHPDHPHAYAWLTRFYATQQEVEKGLSVLQSLESVNKPRSRLAQAKLLSKVGRHDEALTRLRSIYDPLIESRSRLALDVARAMSRIHRSGHNDDGARAAFDPLISADLFVHEARLFQIDVGRGTEDLIKTTDQLDALSDDIGPEQHHLRYGLMRRYTELGRHDRALAVLEDWISKTPQVAGLLRAKGELLLDMERPSEAVAAFQQAARIGPEEVQTWYRLAQLSQAHHDYPGAEAALRQMAKVDSTAQYKAMSALAHLFLTIGLTQQATVTLEALDELPVPDDPQLLLSLGRDNVDVRRDHAARRYLEQLPISSSRSTAAQVLLSRIERRNGQARNARTRFDNVLQTPRTVATAIKELLAMRLVDTSEEELLQWADAAVTAADLPDEVRKGWLNTCVVLRAHRRDWRAMLVGLNDLAQFDPNGTSWPIDGARVALLVRLDEIKRARQIYHSNKILAESRIGPLLQVVLGEPLARVEHQDPWATLLHGLIAGESAQVKSALQHWPSDRMSYRTDLLTLLQRPDLRSTRAVDGYRHFALAVAAQRLGLGDLSAEVAREVMQSIPWFVPAAGVLAQTLLDQDRAIDEAVAHVDSSLPNSSLSLMLSALTHANRDEDYIGALKQLAKLKQREPANVHLRHVEAQWLQKLGRFDEAIHLLDQLYAHPGPHKLATGNALAYLLAEHGEGRLETAHQIAKNSHDAAPENPAFLDTLGWIEHLRGNDRQALQYLLRSSSVNPSIPEVQYHLGIVHRALSETSWARYYLEQAAIEQNKSPKVADAQASLSHFQNQP